MGVSQVSTFIGIFAVFIIADASQNETRLLDKVIGSEIKDTLPFVSSPPKLTPTWPPLISNGSSPDLVQPEGLRPPEVSVTFNPPSQANTSVVTKRSNYTSTEPTLATVTLTSASEPQTLAASSTTSSLLTSSSQPSSPLPSTSLSSSSQLPSSSFSSICSKCSSAAVTVTTPEGGLQHSEDPTRKTSEGEGHVSIAVFLVVPVCIGLIISFFILFGKYCRKKLRLDKLRHQLMPMYSFDPAEGEDWETELLTDPRTQANHQTQATQASRPTGSTDVPQLRFTPPVVDV
ncbi:uncharacterized protein [Diadema antillarum]|uniref:uncharacterized protein n=1 Tax=Diadema antillarum TaxID=105358 RepID=UPI003A8C5D4A